jgi:hypothetical protein
MSITLDPSSIAELWRRARAMFARASAVIGAAEALAALCTLTRVRRREIAGWLALVEGVVRKLILAEAAAIGPGERESSPSRGPALEIVTLRTEVRGAPVQQPRSLNRAFDLQQPESWPARFKLAPPRDPLTVPESRAPRIRALWGPSPPAPPPPQQPARQNAPPPLHLALRLEALRRVIADPEPYVRRLARLMPRLWRREPRAPERYATAPARPHWVDAGDPCLIIEVMALALCAAPMFVNSS